MRGGQAQAAVSVVFDVAGRPSRPSPLLDENGLAGEAGEPLVIRRHGQVADGGSRAFVNDQVGLGQALRELGALARRDPRPA